ncbi:MazG family protein [Tessaracoccus antarcticus]|uniref:Nucleoside triphosphate pyrophosphohydrolase n=1 Tax=Tessaracoccus antarcticus TaxID=2479848 RepID=A0A3M0GXT2_9ACTN|nr:MazG family protein [Tessaracoccus antarcticus]RMB62186.1 nucleoside triphosphate pyrophosphohydrolase [Tessaracoccus antarcticus]
MASELERLRDVTAELRLRCPWDARQTHASLLTHLVEETCEVVDAVESGDDDELCEELGDLLLQVYFHARIAEDEGRFALDDVARGVSDKLVRRHPHVFAGEEAPDDIRVSWEARKRVEKGRTSSLQGIAQSMSSVARAQKVISRTRSHGVPVALPEEPVTADEVGREVMNLVARAQASGVDADAAIRGALRTLEADITAAEEASRH